MHNATPTSPHRRLTVSQVPCVTEFTWRSGVLETDQTRVSLTPATINLITMCQLERKPAVLVTPPNARLSAQLAGEFARVRAEWILRYGDGTLQHARSGAILTTFDDVWNLPSRRSALPAPVRSVAAIEFEVVVYHRASADVVVGGVAELLVAGFGAPALTGLGGTEPLPDSWDRVELTRRAQRGMPRTMTFRAGNDAGAALALSYERDTSGVLERVTGMIPVGDYDAVIDTLPQRCAEVLADLQRRFVVFIATMAASDVDPDGWMSARLRRTPRPRALLLGPYALRKVGADTSRLTEIGGRNVGRSMVPAFLHTFDGDETDAWVAQAKVLDVVGLEETLHGIGAM